MTTASRAEPGFRVLHVLAPARAGGLERVVEMLAAGQGPRAEVATVLTPGDAPAHPVVLALRGRGITVHEIVVPGRAYRREYRSLRALLASSRPDIVHTHGYRADIIGGMAARRAGVPVCSTVHGFIGGGGRNRLNEFLQSHALRRIEAVIAVSGPLVGRLEAIGVKRDRIHLVPNAYAPHDSMVGRADARRRLGLDPGALVVGWVGRLSSEKGPDVMLEAIAASEAAWRLSMVGQGRELERLTRLATALGIADRVTWHGAVPGAGSLIPAFDAFALSSRTEGTPIVLFEAMAAGVPIVATRVGGVPDVVRAGEALLVPAEHPGAIAAALAELLRDRAGTSSRCDAARDRVARAFAIAPWLVAIERVYADAVRT